MAQSFLEEEKFSSNDIVSSLWNKNAAERCRIGLADTLVYEDGVPVRWYVTGKTGDVTKKRSVDMDLVSQRWLKIREQYGSPVVAIVRQTGGVLKFLNVEAWKVFISTKADSSVQSVHCFINGENHQVYRSTFRIMDKLGRSNSSLKVSHFELTNEAPDSVVIMYEHKMKYTESRAHEIIRIMGLATSTVQRYVEMMLQVRILSMTIDYVIDKKSQVWMLWAPEATFIRATSLEQANLPAIVDAKGRAAWMGEKYFEGKKDQEERDSNEHTRRGGRRSPTTGAGGRSPSPNSRTTGGFSPTRSRAPFSTVATEGSPTSHGPGSIYQPHPSRDDIQVRNILVLSDVDVHV